VERKKTFGLKVNKKSTFVGMSVAIGGRVVEAVLGSRHRVKRERLSLALKIDVDGRGGSFLHNRSLNLGKNSINFIVC